MYGATLKVPGYWKAVDLNAKNEAWGRKVTDARALKLMDIPKIYEWQLS